MGSESRMQLGRTSTQLPAHLPTWLIASPGAVVWWRKSKKTPENGVTPIAETLSRSFVKRGAKSLFRAICGAFSCYLRAISTAFAGHLHGSRCKPKLFDFIMFHRFKALFLSVVALSLALPFYDYRFFTFKSLFLYIIQFLYEIKKK